MNNLEEFFTIFAWIMLIPTTFYIIWISSLFIIAITNKNKTLRINNGYQILVNFILWAMSIAWILSR